MLKFYDFKGNPIWFATTDVRMVKELRGGPHDGKTRLWTKGHRRPWLLDIPIDQAVTYINRSIK